MYLSEKEVQQLVEKKDLTQDNNHCISLMVDKIKTKLADKYGLAACVERGSRIVSTQDNYYELGYHHDEVTLSSRYTKYISETTMLRTQMTCVIPSLMKSYKGDGDKLWICPGIVYRRDVRDKTHVGEPHQMDIWYLTQHKQQRQDLLSLVGSIISIIEELKGQKIKWRYHETSHHYTDEGIEVEIDYNNQWLELLECGLISQGLLQRNGLSAYHGLALGLGLERIVMITKDIDDIRLLYCHKPEIQAQLCTLNKYKAVSSQPAIKRDLSVAIDKTINEEELTELILSLVCKQTQNIIQSIKMVSQTNYESLPQVAIERLGMHCNQKNVLVSIVLRDLEKTLTSEEANRVYTQIYERLHQGSGGYKI